jgi:PPOX class probable F420-dependent enzyme
MPLEGDELRAFLEEPRVCHWATVGPDGHPRVRPLWFLYEDGALWFTTRMEARRAGADVAAGSQVAVSIASDDRPFRAVLLHGTPDVYEGPDRDERLERLALRYGEREGRFWLRGARKEPDRVVLRLVPEKVLAWHYGKGDYRRLQEGASLRVDLP